MEVSMLELNPLLKCGLCKGYLVDATTVNDCLHSFCRSCILTHLHRQRHQHSSQGNHTSPYNCPTCGISLHVSRPESQLHPDRLLQSLVYKLVPGLFDQEMADRRHYFADRPPHERLRLSPEKRGDGVHPLRQHGVSSSSNNNSSSAFPLIDASNRRSNHQHINASLPSLDQLHTPTTAAITTDTEFISLDLEYFGPEQLFGVDSCRSFVSSSACHLLPVIKREPMALVMQDDEEEEAAAMMCECVHAALCMHLLVPTSAPLHCLASLVQHKLCLKRDVNVVFFLPHRDSALPTHYTLQEVAELAHYTQQAPLCVFFGLITSHHDAHSSDANSSWNVNNHQAQQHPNHSNDTASSNKRYSNHNINAVIASSAKVTTSTPPTLPVVTSSSTTGRHGNIDIVEASLDKLKRQTSIVSVAKSASGEHVSSPTTSSASVTSSSDEVYDPHRDRSGCVPVMISHNRKSQSRKRNLHKVSSSSTSRRKRSRHCY